MPKVRPLTEAQARQELFAQADRLLLGEIEKSKLLLGETTRESAAAVGMELSTFRTLRRRDPGTYRLFELRRLIQHFGWSDRTVCAIMGVPYNGGTQA